MALHARCIYLFSCCSSHSGKTTAAGKLALYLKEREVDMEAVAAMDPEE
jgi:signal recognition particle GTPase